MRSELPINYMTATSSSFGHVRNCRYNITDFLRCFLVIYVQLVLKCWLQSSRDGGHCISKTSLDRTDCAGQATRQGTGTPLVAINLGDVGDEVKDPARVAPLVVVPGNQLDKVLVQGDTGLGVEDGGVRVAVHVGGDNVVLGVGQDACQRNCVSIVVLGYLCLFSVMGLTLEGTLRSSLDGVLDVVVGSVLLNADGQIHNGDVGGGHTHGHASELAVEVGNDLANGLGGTSGGRNDVLGGSTTTTPVLGGGTVDGLLGGSVGVDGGHQTLDDGEVVVNDLGQGSQAVGGAGSVGDDIGATIVGLLIDTHHVHGGIGGGSRDDDLLGTTLQVGLGLLGGGEDTSGLDDVGGTGLAPGDGSGVTLGVELDLLAVDDQVGAVDLDVTLEVPVGGVILEHVGLRERRRQSAMSRPIHPVGDLTDGEERQRKHHGGRIGLTA